MSTEYLKVEDVAELLHISTRTVHEMTRQRRIPFRRPPYTRRCLFNLAEIEAWMNGAKLETEKFEGNGLAVRPASGSGAS